MIKSFEDLVLTRLDVLIKIGKNCARNLIMEVF